MPKLKSYRLIPSKYPPIYLYEDVADADEFEALYLLESMTNPRLKEEAGETHLLPVSQIPFQCTANRSYATSPFTHISKNGGRFNDGFFGALYVADTRATACSEVFYHTRLYYQNIEGLAYDRAVFRCLRFAIDYRSVHDITAVAANDPLYSLDDYTAGQQLAQTIRAHAYEATGEQGIYYRSVRHNSGFCWAFFTPIVVQSVAQTAHYQMIWNGKELGEPTIIHQPK